MTPPCDQLSQRTDARVAAAHYSRGIRSLGIGALLSCLLAGCGGPDPEQPMPDIEHARLTRISEQPGAVRLDGLGAIRGFARGRDCTFMHCLELVLGSMGRPISYDELMGMSGMAFRTQFRVDRWDVGNPDPIVGEACLDAVFSSIGMQYDLRVVRRDELSEAAALRGDIAKSIDRAVPVLAANIIRPEDWGVIVGYRADQQWLCRSYNGGAMDRDRVADGWPTAVVLIGKRLPPPARRDVLNAAIRRAVELFQRRQAGRYVLGSRAFDAWCQELRRVDDRTYLHSNAWTYVCLMDARAAAVRFLRGIAPEFGAQGEHLNAAADFYDQELQLLRANYKYVPAERDFPNSTPPPEMRERQIDVLLRARAIEQKAVDEMQKAL